MRPVNLQPRERIIFALDVPTRDAALKLVDALGDEVSFYKVGLELLMAGVLEQLLSDLRGKSVFVDLKLPGDIPETVRRAVAVASRMGVKFLTLSSSVRAPTIRAAVQGRAGALPQLLFVSFLSSQNRADFAEQEGRDPATFEHFIEARTDEAKAAGADGFIVSGQEIALLRTRYPGTVLVSPGIRPSWASADDHKRACTPAEAIGLGADYLVIGRPIRDARDPREAARRVVEEIAGAKAGGHPRG